MGRIDIAPEHDIAVGTMTDAADETFVAVDLSDGGTDQSVRLYFRLAHFVAFADHLRSVADAIVEAKRKD